MGYFTEESVVPQKNTSLCSQQCLSFLLAGKCIGKNVTISECYFSIASQKHIVNIDCNNVVSSVMANVLLLLYIMLQY